MQSDIRNYNDIVDRISRLHTQLLQDVGPSNSRGNEDLENFVEETRTMSASIKRRIEALRRQPVDARSQLFGTPKLSLCRPSSSRPSGNSKERRNFIATSTRTEWLGSSRLVRSFNTCSICGYCLTDATLSVNPNATQDEIDRVVNDNASGQVFAQALMDNRFAESQGTYREVQQRHEEILRINKTIAELAQLFNDVR